MNRKNVIVALTPNQPPIVCGSFAKLCKELNLPYWSGTKKSLPQTINGYEIHKVSYNSYGRN